MLEAKKIYAIYPYNKDGEICGVYVGMTHDIYERMQNHYHNQTETQKELHTLMRENGFHYQILQEVESRDDEYKEFDWMDFFKTQTNIRLFNNRLGKRADFRRIETLNTKPIWNGGGIAWQLSTFSKTDRK